MTVRGKPQEECVMSAPDASIRRQLTPREAAQ